MLRRLRGLVLAVAGVAALLVVASRWAGETMRQARQAREIRAASAGAASSAAPDLSFYNTLGTERPGASAGLDDPAGGRPAAPGRVAPDRGVFVVQVLATRDAAQARRVRDRLAARGLPAVVSEGRAGRQPIFRVRVGRYADRQGADAVVRRLRAEKGLTPWILRETE